MTDSERSNMDWRERLKGDTDDWPDVLDEYESEIERLLARLAEVEQQRDKLLAAERRYLFAIQAERRRAERAEAERDRAIETRENANAVSVRVEIENRQLRERAERAEAALREMSEAAATHARTLDDRALGHPEHLARDRDAIDNDLYNVVRSLDPEWWDARVPGLASVPSSLDAQKEPWEVLRDAPSVTDLACECENPVRESYTGRDGLRHCWQCDGRVDAPKENDRG